MEEQHIQKSSDDSTSNSATVSLNLGLFSEWIVKKTIANSTCEESVDYVNRKMFRRKNKVLRISRKSEEENEGNGDDGRTVVVGLKLDSQSKELLIWALVKVANPGDQVIAVNVLNDSEIVNGEGNSSLLSLVKAFDSVLAVYEGFCNLKQIQKARRHYVNLQLSSACEAVLEIGNAGNVYMDECAPWSLFKKGTASKDDAAKVLVIILEAMRIIAVALSPIAPNLCQKIYAQLGYSEDQFGSIAWSDTRWGGLKAGQVMAQAHPIFARIEKLTEEEGGETGKKIVKGDKKSQVPVAAEV
ncbi:methionine--tRNA ligase [Ranunculus cassubicifolius]